MLSYRKPTIKDLLLYFKWANEPEVRKQSYKSTLLDLEDHQSWFSDKLKDENCVMFLFESEGQPVGQVRFQKQIGGVAIVGVTVDNQFRGRGMATNILKIASEEFLRLNTHFSLHAYIKKDNVASVKAFLNASFSFKEKLVYLGCESVLYVRNADNI
jgi:RimJ/RimL family protein N-acetyltransferase